MFIFKNSICYFRPPVIFLLVLRNFLWFLSKIIRDFIEDQLGRRMILGLWHELEISFLFIATNFFILSYVFHLWYFE